MIVAAALRQEVLEMSEYTDLNGMARTLRRHVIEMVGKAKSGHPGGSLSAAEIITALYFKAMRVDPKNPDWEDRDRFVLSKGHVCPVLYAALAEKGFFPAGELGTFRRINSRLQGHPASHKTPGVEVCSGSLGQGLSQSVGLALAGRLKGKDYRVYALLGDGEIQEGQVWEAAMAAAHYRVANLTIFIDYNGLQIDGPVNRVLSPLPIEGKWEQFGWKTLTIDGHDIDQILRAIDEAKAHSTGPTAIVARTVKGKGVSFMENRAEWHGTAPNAEQMEQALRELSGGV